MTQPKVLGYLPDEKPSLGKLILYAIQQVIVMFPATVTVALITGFQVSTTIFASGLATVCFILITGRKIPMYYGSSFAYLSAISGLIAAQGFVKVDGILPPEAISIAQFGIIASGLVSIAAGLLVRLGGMKMVEKILPATITGPIAMIIGLTLAGNAMMDAAPQAAQSQAVWVVPDHPGVHRHLQPQAQGLPGPAAPAAGRAHGLPCRRPSVCPGSCQHELLPPDQPGRSGRQLVEAW